ncbi:MAG: FAD-dependent oxidoreductase [Planctomycetota bacterium]
MIAPERNNKDKIGAVLVIGGGIAGIQASLDLAESGQKVYLLESSPAIGGNMARLDKTFPTNDCSMCILSPKIVECGRHLNIETITWSQLEGLQGQAGNFKAKIRRRARYVDMDKCTGCGDCTKACPVAVPNEFDAGIGERHAIFRPYPQAYPNTFVIDKKGKSPCRVGCPAGINIHGYVALTAAGKFDEALDVVLQTIPLPGVLGRVCDHPCQERCHLSKSNDSVSICAIKRFLADKQREKGTEDKKIRKGSGSLAKVAIIGGGPAGLASARELARKGYQPTIFEAMQKAGGMLAWGIPDYRLPPEILDEEIQDVLDEGVQLQTNVRLGRDITIEQLKKAGFKAVVLAIGAQGGMKLGIEGENLKGVEDCIEFLRQVNLDRSTVKVGRKVVVIGGGNSAIDSARTALRLGAEEVTLLYRRTRAEMPAIDAEIVDAEKEGVKLHFLSAPVRVIGKANKVASLECIQMRLGEPDESGRRRPVPIEGSQFTLETDMIISAIGQKVRLVRDETLNELKTTRWGTIDADEKSTFTNIEGVFAVGDAVTGPASVIKAIAGGRRAAQAVDCYLRGVKFEPLPEIQEADITNEPPMHSDTTNVPGRSECPQLPPAQRAKSFDEVEATFSEEQAIAEAKRCLNCAICSECMECVQACKAKAICHEQQDKVEQINVGAVIALPGFEEYAAQLKYDFGYSRYPDVVSSMQFERILSASGPFMGHVRRPSDGKEPRKIAFLQCVGSRDTDCRNGYCSSVCCMYAIKEAVIAKEHIKGVDVTIFFMDMRAFGKDFDKYYERAKDEYGVHFKRSRVCDVYKKDGEPELTVKFAPDSGGVEQEQFDMVVLSIGLEPGKNSKSLAEKLGVRLEPNGFIWTDSSTPLNTSREGIFVGGAASGPKDIPETVMQASGTASLAAQLLAESRNTLTVEQEFPKERDILGQEPRIGVFICHCGINIGGVVDVPSVAQYAGTLPGVVHAEENLYTCSQDTQDHIKEIIEEHNLNRVVVASCSPRTHEPLFQQTLREAGLNPHLFEMANIRDQCSWIHMNEPEKATIKAKDLVAMAVAKASLLEPLHTEVLPVTHSALVLGGGLAGMTAAIAIAEQGFDVCLVEQTNTLGGNLNRLRSTFDLDDMGGYVKELCEKVQKHKRIKVYTETELAGIEGFVGNFESVLKRKGRKIKVSHGAVVVATGGSEYRPQEYLYGQDRKIVTQLELEELMTENSLKQVNSVVMIQCTGSREKGHMYCSRVCCNNAVKNAVKIKQNSPDTEVYILYRDVRSYGFSEEHYQKARRMGVMFIRYDLDRKPEVSKAANSFRVTVYDSIADAQIVLNPDLLVLSSRIDANPANRDIAKLLKVPVNDDGFFIEAHVKLRPVEFATEGVFVAGLSHSPKSMPETIAQAQAAAAKACAIIAKDNFEGEAKTAHIDVDICAACGTCVGVCAYRAIELVCVDERRGTIAAYVNPALCKGCGTCAATCRSGAMDIKGVTDRQIKLMIEAL